MTKRGSKPSRRKRKQIRAKSTRAEEHGLPSRKLDRPSKPPVSASEPPPRRRRKRDDEDDLEESEESEESEREVARKPAPGLADKIRELPPLVKIGAVVLVILAGLWVVARMRQSAASAPAAEATVPPRPIASAAPEAPVEAVEVEEVEGDAVDDEVVSDEPVEPTPAETTPPKPPPKPPTPKPPVPPKPPAPPKPTGPPAPTLPPKPAPAPKPPPESGDNPY